MWGGFADTSCSRYTSWGLTSQLAVEAIQGDPLDESIRAMPMERVIALPVPDIWLWADKKWLESAAQRIERSAAGGDRVFLPPGAD